MSLAYNVQVASRGFFSSTLYIGTFNANNDTGIKVYRKFFGWCLCKARYAVPLQLKNRKIVYVNKKIVRGWIQGKTKTTLSSNPQYETEINNICKKGVIAGGFSKCVALIRSDIKSWRYAMKVIEKQKENFLRFEGNFEFPLIVMTMLSSKQKAVTTYTSKTLTSDEFVVEYFDDFRKKAVKAYNLGDIRGPADWSSKVVFIGQKGVNNFEIFSRISEEKESRLDRDVTVYNLDEKISKYKNFQFSPVHKYNFDLNVMSLTASQYNLEQLALAGSRIIHSTLAQYKDNFLGDEDIDQFKLSNPKEYEKILNQLGFWQGYCKGFKLIKHKEYGYRLIQDKNTGLSASKNVDLALSNISFLSPFMRCQLVVFKMLSTLLGEKEFDILGQFDSNGDTLLDIERGLNDGNILKSILKYKEDFSGREPGDIVINGDLEEYAKRHQYSLNSEVAAFFHFDESSQSNLFTIPGYSQKSEKELQEFFLQSYKSIPRKWPVVNDSWLNSLQAKYKPNSGTMNPQIHTNLTLCSIYWEGIHRNIKSNKKGTQNGT